jgi:hypothetical protein
MPQLTVSDCSVVYTIVIHHTEQRQYQIRSCHSLQCQTATCDCAVLDGVMWHSPCTQWLTAAGSTLNFLNFPPPIMNQFRWTATNLSHPQLAPSPLTGNSLTLHAAWRHSIAESLDCSNCYQFKCDGHCEFWGSRRTAWYLFTAGTM